MAVHCASGVAAGGGLAYPALLTLRQGFGGPKGDQGFTLANYDTIFSDPAMLRLLANTAVWTLAVPLLATAVGLAYAVLVDRSRGETFAKPLVFMPMAISMVGASIIWKFVYEYKPKEADQIGLLNAVITFFGGEPQQFLLDSPWNTGWLIVVMVWIQAGFAMTVLSASIKAIPDDIIEAAKIDGSSGMRLFSNITLPSIRGSLVVVLTTIAIGTLKVFDIVRTMTGGQFNTSVVANEFYNQLFAYNNYGIGAALATLLFVLVIPIVAYNVIQLRRS